jgi:hypothetical protein
MGHSGMFASFIFSGKIALDFWGAALISPRLFEKGDQRLKVKKFHYIPEDAP